ncbi:unnamed protein product [Anisakis simplex]|uniref:Fibronectin type-III domain-containing protein n=1 Tax=Anisakis simplex TaxID=6269 RepID=A0A0M3JB75_ANISI|nr:unnamed protein product [Anisakis simplex]
MVAEISADHIRWAVQSRSSGSEAPWHVTVLEDKAFKDDTKQYKTVIPSEFANEIEVRLCVSWRSNVIVSRTVRQSIIGIGGRPHAPKLIAQLQISSNSYVICWNSPLPRLYKVSLYSLDGKQISSDETTNQCYLFTNIPTENCCRANIGYATFTEPSIDVAVKLELANTNGLFPKYEIRNPLNHYKS